MASTPTAVAWFIWVKGSEPIASSLETCELTELDWYAAQVGNMTPAVAGPRALQAPAARLAAEIRHLSCG